MTDTTGTTDTTISTGLTPGTRQTVMRVRHPHRGEGIAVRSNGPSFFQPDGGAAIPMRVSFGGWSSTGHPDDPKRSWSWVRLDDPQFAETKALVLKHGDVHQRAWHRFLGAGWLVGLDTGADKAEMRFDPDDASRPPVHFSWSVARVGHPKAIHAQDIAGKDYEKREKRGNLRHGEKRPRMSEDDAKWLTYTSRDGETWVFFVGEGAPKVDPYASTEPQPAAHSVTTAAKQLPLF